MMVIDAGEVKKLRDKTGAGIMDCKRALREADGDFVRAEEILKELGLAAVAKRAGRVTQEGRIFTALGTESVGIMEICCETDFVARSKEFIRVGHELLTTALEEELSVDDHNLHERINELAATIKENLTLRRFERINITDTQLAMDYVHGDAGTIGTLLILELTESALRTNSVIRSLAKDLALHATAFCPLYLSIEKVESSYLSEQEKIFRAQVKQLEKPAHILDGIIKGKMHKHLSSVCFLEQAFVKDEKRSVAKVIADTSATLGTTIALLDYRVLRAGEEL